MKVCTNCEENKSLEEYRKYSKSKDGRASCCKVCVSAKEKLNYATNEKRRVEIRSQNEARYLRNQLYVREYLSSHSCVDCGLDDPELLEFDHVRGVKICGVMKMVKNQVSIEKLQNEMDKCEVRCLHCHRKRTIKQFGWYLSMGV